MVLLVCVRRKHGATQSLRQARRQPTFPPLEINNVPTDAKVWAVVCHDPDTPGRDDGSHWLGQVERDETAEKLPAGHCRAVPFNITSWGATRLEGGPLCRFGTPAINFYVYALDTTLGLARRQHQAQEQSRRHSRRICRSGSDSFGRFGYCWVIFAARFMI